jgi:hypothetical protein
MQRGYHKLDAEQKIRLMDGFSSARAYSMIPLLLLIAAYWVLDSQTNLDKQYLAIGYFGLLIVYVLARAALNQRKVAHLGLPKDYNRMFTVAQAVSLVGVAWFFFAMVYQ